MWFIRLLTAISIASALKLDSQGAVKPLKPLIGSIDLTKRSQICGAHGYSKKTNAYFYQKSASLATVSACGARCKADHECKSFAVGDGACMTYSVPM